MNLVVETSIWRMVFPCFPYSWITCESIICILQTLNVWPKFYLHFGSLEGKLAALEILAHLLRMVMDLKDLCVSVTVGPPNIFSEFWLDAKGRYTSVSDAFYESLRLHPTNHRGSRMRLSCWNESSIPTSWGAKQQSGWGFSWRKRRSVAVSYTHIGTMGLVYLPTWRVNFHGQCRQIVDHTWMLWDRMNNETGIFWNKPPPRMQSWHIKLGMDSQEFYMIILLVVVTGLGGRSINLPWKSIK